MNCPNLLPILASAALCVASGTAHAQSQSEWPQEMQYKGKPLPAICMDFMGDSSRFDSRELADCAKKEHDLDIESRKPFAKTSGLVGYSYHFDQTPREAYIFYKYLGKTVDGLYIFNQSAGGGSGAFTSIDVITREGDSIKLTKEIVGGDRCNGGVANAELNGVVLTYSQMVTPRGFLKLAGKDAKKLGHYSLDDSAVACAGAATYRDGKLVTLSLAPAAGYGVEDTKGWTERFAYQSCFNKVYAKYVDKGKTELDQDGIEAFVNEFEAACMPKEKTEEKTQ